MSWIEVNSGTGGGGAINLKAVDDYETDLPNLGDYEGTTAVLTRSSVSNDLTSHVGKFVNFVDTTSGEGKWELLDASDFVTGNAYNLVGVVTSDTTASTPSVLINGIIRLDGDDIGSTPIDKTDDKIGFGIYANPNTQGRITWMQSDIGIGNILRVLGYIVSYDSTNSNTQNFVYFYLNPSITYLDL